MASILSPRLANIPACTPWCARKADLYYLHLCWKQNILLWSPNGLSTSKWFHAFCNSAQDSFENLTWLKEYSESMKEYHEWVKDKPYRKTKSTLSRPCPHKGYVAHILGAGIMLLNQNNCPEPPAVLWNCFMEKCTTNKNEKSALEINSKLTWMGRKSLNSGGSSSSE